jgi:hypothetical protein
VQGIRIDAPIGSGDVRPHGPRRSALHFGEANRGRRGQARREMQLPWRRALMMNGPSRMGAPCRTSMRRFISLVLLVGGVGCGGSDQPAKAPGGGEHNDMELPGTIEEAQDELQKSKLQVESASECDQLCKAFSSMRRSAAAMCVLTGQDDPRCAAAKQTVDDASKRVAKCSCPSSP